MKKQKNRIIFNEKYITKILHLFQKYYKNISKIFQIVLTFVSKCNIYNTKGKTQNKWRNYLGDR